MIIIMMMMMNRISSYSSFPLILCRKFLFKNSTGCKVKGKGGDVKVKMRIGRPHRQTQLDKPTCQS